MNLRHFLYLDVKQREKDRRTEEANERFNIRNINGKDYITYNGVAVSREGDDDLIERLKEYRKNYIG